MTESVTDASPELLQQAKLSTMLRNKMAHYKSPVALFERHRKVSTGIGPKRSEYESEFDLEQVTWPLMP